MARQARHHESGPVFGEALSRQAWHDGLCQGWARPGRQGRRVLGGEADDCTARPCTSGQARLITLGLDEAWPERQARLAMACPAEAWCDGQACHGRALA